MKISVRDIVFSYKQDEPLLEDVSFEVKKGEFVGVLGPNGCGKTTLLKLMSGTLRPFSGSVRMGAEDVAQAAPQKLARLRSVVPQESHLEFDHTVRDVVAMARTIYAGTDRAGIGTKKIDEALELCEITQLQHRNARNISGGEWQRVLIARAFAQDTPVILLDEPTHFLDLHNKARIVSLLRNMSKKGKTIVAVLHDIAVAKKICTTVVLLKGGKVFSAGKPDMVLTPQAIATLYDVSRDEVRSFA